jgi:hypothetical protein
MRKLFKIKHWYTHKEEERPLEMGDIVIIADHTYRIMEDPDDSGIIYCQSMDPDLYGMHRFYDTQVNKVLEPLYEEFTIKPKWM